MKVFIISILLFFSISTNALSLPSAHSSQLPSNVFALEPNPCDSIRNGQFVCKDCQTMAFCVQRDQGWETLTIGSCSGSLYCDEAAHGCTYQTECPLQSKAPRFQCQQPGTYPDPYDCKQYHVCNVQNQDERQNCPSGLAYSPATKSCSLKTTNDICASPQYDCPQLGYMAAWPLDENIYYVCLIQQSSSGTLSMRYPALYRCPDGQIFKKDRCIGPTSNSISTTTVKETSSTETSSTKCSMANSLVGNTNDCYSYFVCIKGELLARRCPEGSYFESTSLSCRFGRC